MQFILTNTIITQSVLTNTIITCEVYKDCGQSYQHQVKDIFHHHGQDQVARETHNGH